MRWRLSYLPLLALLVPFQAYGAQDELQSAELSQIIQQLKAFKPGDSPDDRRFRELLARAEKIWSGTRPGASKHMEGRRAATAPPPTSDIQRGQDEYRREHGISPPPIPPKKTIDTICDPPNNFYLRADRLDTYLYGVQSLDAAKGASVSYTNDSTTGHHTTNVSGLASYVLFRNACIDPPKYQTNDSYLAGYAIAPWVYGNGVATNFGTKTKPDQSALKFGIDAQAAWIGGTIIDASYFTASPYYQTDFSGLAQIYGFTASWQPLSADLNLGGALGKGTPFLYWFWQFAAEADLRTVQVPGLTQLHHGGSELLGATSRLHLFLLPVVFNHRLHADGTFEGYWDAVSSKWITEYITSLAYNLTDDGNVAISVAYTNGTDKDTFKGVRQYVVKFDAKY